MGDDDCSPPSTRIEKRDRAVVDEMGTIRPLDYSPTSFIDDETRRQHIMPFSLTSRFPLLGSYGENEGRLG